VREYETTFIVQPEISEEACNEFFARIDALLEREGAERLLHEDWGKRKLAYEIQRFQKGRYVTTFYLDEGTAVEPFERLLRLEESVLRFLTVQRADDVPDLEARRAEAKEQERVQAERARERAEREAEEEKAREEARRADEAAAAQRAEAEAAAQARAEAEAKESGDDDSPEGSTDETPSAEGSEQ
jgi:small subunit ribosomal protein S6